MSVLLINEFSPSQNSIKTFQAVSFLKRKIFTKFINNAYNSAKVYV
jgi:hypothetical protein